MVKGFHQQLGIDYTKTFIPVVKPTTIWLVLFIAFIRGWLLRQIDTNSAFLHGLLTKTIYMQ